MELRKSNGRFCLQKGWPEFVKYYSIGFGHFLVFRYEGNSRFHACIFDTTTVEIEYPLIRAHSDGPKIEEIKDDGSVEVLEDLSPYPRKRKSSPLPCSQPHKKFRTSPIGETEIKGTRSNERILKNSMRNGDLHHSKSMRGMRKFFLLSFKKLIFWYLNKLLFPCRVVFLYCLFSFILFPVSAEDGKGDKSIMPRWRLSEVKSFTYKVVIKPSHVGKYFDMCLPRKFADGFLKNKCLDAVLKLSDGGTWPIRFRSRRCDDERRRGARFEKPSWEKFARDNNLKVADTCVFELINGNEMSFKVSILKADLDSHPSHDQTNSLKPKRNVKVKTECDCTSKHQEETKVEPGKFWQGQVTCVPKFSGDSRATEAASRFSSKNPFFKKLITSSYLHTQSMPSSGPHCGRGDLGRGDLERPEWAIQSGPPWTSASEAWWNVKILIESHIAKFVRRQIEMGRKPRPLKRYPSIFKVLIDDFSNKLMIPVAFVKHFDGKIPRRCLLWSPAERFWNVNVENFGRIPAIRLTRVRKEKYAQGIPTSFFKMYMNKLERGSTVMLQHKGRSWPVKFCVDERPTARLSTGWSKFVNANAIKLRDVCVF
ncbi:B3 domain-containing transcription factor VRN1 [Morus notabilis]|uniref:B3 domain-containing transcription factor VRN1 n=1 Tax=Morus notabilis TaxID=981085 RepID=W9QPF1_9ROSA|nr:B3 domain-containing transcription factor VRN1 [Morus notabilis]